VAGAPATARAPATSRTPRTPRTPATRRTPPTPGTPAASQPEPVPTGTTAAGRLGGRLRTLRAARNLTIAQLADASGLTKGFISRLERDQTSVSIAALLRICEVLQISIGTLFEAPATALVRDGEAPVVDFGGGLRHSVRTPAGVDDLRVVRVELDPGAGAGKEEYALHGGTEFVQVLKGKMVVELEADSFVLGCGDSLTFPGRTRHTYRNASRRERCDAVWVIAPSP
jgi:transcriptional regulator with XRE-family HTH domain